jgi:hypothetical protein
LNNFAEGEMKTLSDGMSVTKPRNLISPFIRKRNDPQSFEMDSIQPLWQERIPVRNPASIHTGNHYPAIIKGFEVRLISQFFFDSFPVS